MKPLPTTIEHLELFLQIFNEPVPYTDSHKDDEDACERLLKEFSEAEAEEIASVSYAYWVVRSKAKERLPVDAKRISAIKEIRRHYAGEGRNYDIALAAIREALEYRRTYRIDVIRSCFHDTYDREDKDADVAKKYRRLIIDDLERQAMVVRGVDDHDRCILYKPSRKSSGDTPDADEAFMLAQIYTAERAMAMNELTSKGKEEKVTVVFNFGDYSRKNSPPTSIVKTTLIMAQRCYPERLGVLIITNPPFWLRGVYNLVWPFLSTATTEKIRMPSSQAAVEEEFHKIVSGNKQLEVMLGNGDISSVDFTEYTQQSFYSQLEQKQ